MRLISSGEFITLRIDGCGSTPLSQGSHQKYRVSCTFGRSWRKFNNDDTDRQIGATFDRQGRATRPVVDPRVSFRSAFLKAFRPLSRPTGEPSRHGSGSPVSIEWRSSPARLITSIIAGRHEAAWGRPQAVACSPWLWRASVSSDRRAPGLNSQLTIHTLGRSCQGADDIRTRLGLVRAKTRTTARR
jgi:hypothetical protein